MQEMGSHLLYKKEFSVRAGPALKKMSDIAQNVTTTFCAKFVERVDSFTSTCLVVSHSSSNIYAKSLTQVK